MAYIKASSKPWTLRTGGGGGDVFTLVGSHSETNPQGRKRPNANRLSGKNDDQEWVKEQESTFIHWVNEHLKSSEHQMSIKDLRSGLQDGLVLIELMKIVAPESIQFIKYHKNPRHMKLLRLENVKIALECMKREGIQLLNIEPTDIVDGNLKLTLGLLQTLANHYPITAAGNIPHKSTTKKAMLQWLQGFLPKSNVTNLTTDWNNGILLCTLIDKLRPGLVPDLSSLNTINGLSNTQSAMNIAEQYFDIPKVVTVEALCSAKPKELDVATYLLYFCGPESPGHEYMVNWVNQILPDHQIINFTTDWLDGMTLCYLVNALCEPGAIPGEDKLRKMTATDRVKIAMEAVELELSVNSGSLRPAQFTSKNTDQLQRMAYVAQFMKCRRYSVSSLNDSTIDVSSSDQKNNEPHPTIDINEPHPTIDINEPHPSIDSNDPRSASNNSEPHPTSETRLSSSSNVESEGSSEFEQNAFVTSGVTTGNNIKQENEERIRKTSKRKSKLDELLAAVELDFDDVLKQIDNIGGEVKEGEHEDIDKHPSNNDTVAINPSTAQTEETVVDPTTAQTEVPLELDFDFEFSSDTATSSDIGSRPHSVTPDSAAVILLQAMHKASDKEKQHEEKTHTPQEQQVPLEEEEMALDGSEDDRINDEKEKEIQLEDTDEGVQGNREEEGRQVLSDCIRDDNTREDHDGVDSDQLVEEEKETEHTTLSEEQEMTGNEGDLTPEETTPLREDDHLTPEETTPLREDNHLTPDETTPLNEGDYLTPEKHEDVDVKETVIVEEVVIEETTPLNEATPLNDATQMPDSQLLEHPPNSSTDSHTASPTGSHTDSHTASPTGSHTASPTGSHTASPTGSHTASPTGSHTGSHTASPTGSHTGSHTALPTVSHTDSHTTSPTGSHTDSHTDSRTNSRAGSLTYSPIPDSEEIDLPLDKKVLSYPNLCDVSGRGLYYGIVGVAGSFIVDCSEAGYGRLEVVIESPTGKNLDADGSQIKDSTFRVFFSPNEVGTHKIYISFHDTDVPNSPFSCEVCDPSACVVTRDCLNESFVDRPGVFQVRTEDAGPGTLQTSFDGIAQPSDFQLLSCIDGLYTYQYMLPSAGEYEIEVKWVGQHVPGSPFKVMAKDDRPNPAACVILEQPLENIRVREEIKVRVDCQTAGRGELKALLRSPRGEIACDISVDNNVYTVITRPSDVGDHCLVLQYGGDDIPDSPVRIQVNDPSLIKLDIQHNITQSVSFNKHFIFHVNTEKCGEGRLSAVATSSDAPHRPIDLNVESDMHGHTLTYIPTTLGIHSIQVLYSNKPCFNTPISLKVYDVNSIQDIVLTKTLPAQGTQHLLNRLLTFQLSAPNRDRSDITFSAVGLQTNHTPHLAIEPTTDSSFSLEFKASKPDDYKISVMYKDEHVQGSPFTLPVRLPARANKVTMYDPVIPLVASKPIELVFDTSQAGQGMIAASVLNAKKKLMPVYVEQVNDTIFRVAFIPKESGAFMVSVLYADKHIGGSPFRVLYQEQIKEPSVCVNFQPDMTIKGLMGSAVYGRNCGRQEATVVQYERGKYQISFIPQTSDTFDLHVYWFDTEIEGSPFEIDLSGGMENESSDALVDSVPIAVGESVGILAATTVGHKNGPAPIKLTPVSDSICHIEFTSPSPDKYDLNIFWNNKILSGMPIVLPLD